MPQQTQFWMPCLFLLCMMSVHLSLNLRPSSRLLAQCMQVLRSILKYLPDGLWKDYYAIICFYSSTKAVFDLEAVALLFALLAFPVLWSRAAGCELSESGTELLCCPQQEDCLVSQASLVVFFVSGTWLKGWRVRSPLKAWPQDRWRGTGGTCLCLCSGNSKLGQ